jgi:hypothetical protein
MQRAPHALFRWDDSVPADAHPNVGDALARAAAAACTRDGIAVSDADLWRDVGWSFVARPDGKAFEIYYARYAERVLLAVAPPRSPGLIARLSGAKATSHVPELMRLWSLIHRTLVETPGVKEIYWMIGGPAEEVVQVGTPDQLRWPDDAQTSR